MDVNKRFQTKRTKYSKFCIIKKTEVTPTKFCTLINTTKYPLRVVPKVAHKSIMADGRHLETRGPSSG